MADEITKETLISEDIGILDDQGNLISAIIKEKAYRYFLKKAEEDEEKMDQEELKNFDSKTEKNNALDIDDLI